MLVESFCYDRRSRNVFFSPSFYLDILLFRLVEELFYNFIFLFVRIIHRSVRILTSLLSAKSLFGLFAFVQLLKPDVFWFLFLRAKAATATRSFVCRFVCLSVTRMHQSKKVQARKSMSALPAVIAVIVTPAVFMVLSSRHCHCWSYPVPMMNMQCLAAADLCFRQFLERRTDRQTGKMHRKAML